MYDIQVDMSPLYEDESLLMLSLYSFFLGKWTSYFPCKCQVVQLLWNFCIYCNWKCSNRTISGIVCFSAQCINYFVSEYADGCSDVIAVCFSSRNNNCK